MKMQWWLLSFDLTFWFVVGSSWRQNWTIASCTVIWVPCWRRQTSLTKRQPCSAREINTRRLQWFSFVPRTGLRCDAFLIFLFIVAVVAIVVVVVVVVVVVIIIVFNLVVWECLFEYPSNVFLDQNHLMGVYNFPVSWCIHFFKRKVLVKLKLLS